jgi:hypothetical protein
MPKSKKNHSEAVWISSTDKKSVLSYADKDRLDSFFEKHCPDIGFVNEYEKVIKNNYKDIVEFQNDLNNVYIGFLNKIIKIFLDALYAYTKKNIGKIDHEMIENLSLVFTVRHLYLNYTNQKYLKMLMGIAEGKIKSIEPAILKKQHDELVKGIKEILDCVKKIDKQTENRPIVPDYIKELVKNGYLASDGKTVISSSLDNVAEFLYSLNLDNFNYKMLMQFRQLNGKPFSPNSAKEAIKRCKLK